MGFKCFVIMTLIWSSNVVDGTQSHDFCEAFADKGFKISFGYSAGLQKIFLFIGNNYWFVQKNSNDGTLSLQSSVSKAISLSEKYVIAIHYNICKGSRCEWMTGLWNVSDLMRFFNLVDFIQTFDFRILTGRSNG